jgi:glycosyl transferase, family 25
VTGPAPETVDCGARICATFELILIINLKHRQDRRDEIEEELGRVGLSLDHPAVALLPASSFDDPAGFPNTGARGCFDSHVRALTTAKTGGVKSVLILEDDCDFSRSIISALPPLLDTLDVSDWSLFYGGHLGEEDVNANSSGLTRTDPNQAFTGSHCIGVSAATFDPLIRYFNAMAARAPGSPDGGPMHVDGAYSWFRKDHPTLQTWLATPHIAVQRPSRSDIHTPKLIDRLPGIRTLAVLSRRLRRDGQRG